MADSLPTPADSPQVVNSSTSTTSTDDHLAQGIRYMALRKYAEACESLSYAVEQLTEKHGELSIENVDALTLYGKALLENAIAQSGVLGGPTTTDAAGGGVALPDSVATSTNANATAGPSNVGSSSSAAFHFGGDAEDEEENEEENEEEGGGEGEGGEGEEVPGQDREDDLEGAFNALELARKIVEIQVESIEKRLKEGEGVEEEEKKKLEEKRKEGKEKLAELHRLLGDVATENEQFDSAVEDYSSSLSILTRLRSPSDRILAELHMMIALALEFNPSQLGRAVSHAEKAKGVLVERLNELERKSEGERSEKEKREIEDIKGLLGDVDNKIEDLKIVPVAPELSASDLALEQFLRQASGVGGGAASSTVPVNDLNSLVKKKKKPTTTPAVAPVEQKPKEETEAVKKEEGGGETAATSSSTTTGKVEEEDEGKGKRKAEDEIVEATTEKKVKV